MEEGGAIRGHVPVHFLAERAANAVKAGRRGLTGNVLPVVHWTQHFPTRSLDATYLFFPWRHAAEHQLLNASFGA